MEMSAKKNALNRAVLNKSRDQAIFSIVFHYVMAIKSSIWQNHNQTSFIGLERSQAIICFL